MTVTPQPDPGALSITPADGYQYGDDHPWSGDQQTGLVAGLDKLMNTLSDTGQDGAH
jgi:hypothetical protein